MIGDRIDEQWDFIDEFPDYMVSNYGRVYNIRQDDLLKIEPINGRYYFVILMQDGVRRMRDVHKLVAVAFVDGRFEGAVINHKDGKKGNNYYGNLEWVTQQQNIRHAHDTGLMYNKKIKKNG